MTSPHLHHTSPAHLQAHYDEMDEKHSSHTAETLQGHEIHSTNTIKTIATAHLPPPDPNRALSPQGTREAASRLNDDLEVLRAERLVSNQEHELSKSRSKTRARPDTDDAFNSNPQKDPPPKAPPEKQAGAPARAVWKYLRKFPRFIRYFLYMLPGATLLLVPVLLGRYAVVPGDAAVGGQGGMYLLWFGIWLEIVWCSLWVARMITSIMPLIFGGMAILLGSSNHKKWKDIGMQLELHTALFIWLLAVLCSFMPIVNAHRVPVPGQNADQWPYIAWIDVVNKVIIAMFVLAILNFAEKILIQWIATSFHMRTYSQRIEQNKSDIANVVHLYEHSKQRIAREDSIWETTGEGLGSGARTPMRALQNNARHAWNKVGVVANRVGNDFIGRKTTFNHSRKIVYEMIRSTASAHSLARLIFRSLKQEDRETVFLEDMQIAFRNAEEAEAAFGIFDKDLNGDISMEEMELVCNEIHLERKAIAASLKDLDSVIKKLDTVFLVIIVVIAAIVFISIFSGSAAAGLASAGTTILGLAWMLQATAQEFLQSIIFVFVKHPFDVGDRVTIYGNTGSMMRGDDYYVTEISLLYTEFKKMEGHIVQAPNSLLNTLFILNQRRSAGLADPVELRLGFATSPDLIDELKARMLDYCLDNKRDYQPRIITEVRTINDVQSFTMNFIFFHKSNFQNELLRLTRHNKFVAQLMAEIRNLGMQGPWQVQPGGSRDFPVYWSGAAPPSYDSSKNGANPQPPQNQQATTSTAPVTRHRSDSRVMPAVEENLGDFQDVFESRKEGSQPHIGRLSSIRETPGLTRVESHSSAVARQSLDSGSRRKLFGRPRSKSKATDRDIV